MIKALALIYALVSILSVVGWRRWNIAVSGMSYTNGEKRLVACLYWLLFISLACSSMVAATCEVDDRWTVVGLFFGMAPQAILLGFVYAPLARAKPGRRYGLVKTAMISGSWFLLPVVIGIAFSFWIFHHTQQIIDRFIAK